MKLKKQFKEYSKEEQQEISYIFCKKMSELAIDLFADEQDDLDADSLTAIDISITYFIISFLKNKKLSKIMSSSIKDNVFKFYKNSNMENKNVNFN